MSGSRARTQPAPGQSPELSPAQQAAVAAGFGPDSGNVTTIAVDTTIPEDLPEPDLLDHVEDWRTQRRRYDTKIFRAAAAFADLHAPETGPGTDPATNDQTSATRRRRGGPVPRRYGGEGTPLVMDLAPMSLSVRLQRSTWSTSRLIADALDTRHRLPRLWNRVCAAEVEIWLVRKVAVATRHLSPDAAAYVDAAMASLADGRLPTNRFLARLQGKIVQADPDLAEARARAARTDQFVRLGTANEHGILTIYARGLAQDLLHIDAMVDKLAHPWPASAAPTPTTSAAPAPSASSPTPSWPARSSPPSPPSTPMTTTTRRAPAAACRTTTRPNLLRRPSRPRRWSRPSRPRLRASARARCARTPPCPRTRSPSSSPIYPAGSRTSRSSTPPACSPRSPSTCTWPNRP